MRRSIRISRKVGRKSNRKSRRNNTLRRTTRKNTRRVSRRRNTRKNTRRVSRRRNTRKNTRRRNARKVSRKRMIRGGDVTDDIITYLTEIHRAADRTMMDETRNQMVEEIKRSFNDALFSETDIIPELEKMKEEAENDLKTYLKFVEDKIGIHTKLVIVRDKTQEGITDESTHEQRVTADWTIDGTDEESYKINVNLIKSPWGGEFWGKYGPKIWKVYKVSVKGEEVVALEDAESSVLYLKLESNNNPNFPLMFYKKGEDWFMTGVGGKAGAKKDDVIIILVDQIDEVFHHIKAVDWRGPDREITTKKLISSQRHEEETR